MPLHLHYRLTLPSLADVAADLLRVPPPGDNPFAPDVFVVGGRGVEQWLRLALVERLDIVTNLQIWSPSRFVQDLEQWAVPSARGSVAALTVEILEAVTEDRTLLPTELQHLAGEAGSASVDGLLASWAQRMARTFERYLLYRHDMLLAWERGDAADDWQAQLWRTVAHRSATEFAPAERQRRTRELLTGMNRRSAHADAMLAPRWLILQQGRLAPAHHALIRSLAESREVHLLSHTTTVPLREALTTPHLSPAERRTDVLARQHPVVGRLDRVRADGLLAALPLLGTVTAVTVDAPAPSESGERTLLQSVQRALREEVGAATASWTASPTRHDRSLRVLACHGALRQVEVLKDALLGAFNDDPTLQPRDVLVLTPDPARFVPLVQAVFPLGRESRSGEGRQPEARPPEGRSSEGRSSEGRPSEGRPSEGRRGPPPLALHVQGRSPRATNPVADVLLTLLSLAEERVSASRVLDLLERGPVAERFGIASSDAPLVREWVHTAGVRWGLDASDPARAGLGLTDEGTWRRGLTRLLVGAAVLDGSDGYDTHVHGYAPVPGLEGERVLLAGRAARAVRQLLVLLEAARAPRPLAEWTAFADVVLSRLVAADGVYATSIPRVRDVLATFAHDQAANAEHHPGRPAVRRAAATSHFTASAVAALLEHRLEDVLGAPGRLGGITVAPLGTGWVRPARVIALLGLDDELFPRRGGTPWFDRLAEHPEPGDPDDRGEQLQTVFEAVMLASDQLLVTYTGWNRAGTMRLPPSVAVGALEDVVRDVVAPSDTEAPGDAWRTHVEHDMPLQPFSARAFASTTDHEISAVPSFDVLAAATATRLRTSLSTPPVGRTAAHDELAIARRRETLPLSTLLRFLRRPANEILSRLGIRLDGDALLLEDVLPLTVSRLDESAVVRDMAESLLLGGTLDGQFDALRHRDRMPPAQLGRAWAHDAERRARALAARAHVAVDGMPRRERALQRVTVADTVITGTIDTRHGDRLLFMRDGKHSAHQLTSAFTTLCFAALADPTVQDAVQVDGDRITLLRLPGDPLAVLGNLLFLYHDAERAVPPYAPATSYAYQEAVYKQKGEEQAREAAFSAWDPDNPQLSGECEEPANELLHHASPIDHPEFATFARAVFGPVLEAQA